MTIVNIALTPSRALVLTDSIVMQGDRVYGHTDKVATFPLAGLAVAATGSSHMIAQWTACLCHMHTFDILDLACRAPALMRDIWKANPHFTLTRIYHLGTPREMDGVVGFSFSSASYFEATPMEPGLYLNPDLFDSSAEHPYPIAAVATSTGDKTSIQVATRQAPQPTFAQLKQWAKISALAQLSEHRGCGGSLVSTEISPDEITQRVLPPVEASEMAFVI